MKALLSTLWLLGGAATCFSADFARPVRLEGGGEPVRVESPGYAAPCWADLDADGKPDLLVGQFNQGKIKVYRNLGDGQLAAGFWQSQWQEDITRVSQEYRDAADDQDQDKLRAVNARMQELYAQRAEFVTEDRTGFVWLYLQK